MRALIEKGALGQKTGAGIYRKVGKDILVLDLAAQDYRPTAAEVAPEVVAILKERDPAEKFAALRASEHPQAQFLWACFRDLFHYSAFHLADIAETARDVDLAIRWGYGWTLGPFETWQAAGWKQVADWIAEDIVAGKAMSDAPLPDWVFDGREGVHGAEGSYSPGQNAKLPRSALPVYKRQRFPDPLAGRTRRLRARPCSRTTACACGTTATASRCSASRPRCTRSTTMCSTACRKPSAIAERDFRGMVIWQPKEPFSAGADLSGALGLLQAGDVNGLRGDGGELPGHQPAHQVFAGPGGVRGARAGAGRRLRVPDASAPHRVRRWKAIIGLVEAGVGLLPAGGGLKEFAVRASRRRWRRAATSSPNSRRRSKPWRWARSPPRRWKPRELGLCARIGHGRLQCLRSCCMSPRHAPGAGRKRLPPAAAGAPGPRGRRRRHRHLQDDAGQHAGRSFHHRRTTTRVATRIATVLCGGEVDRGALVDEEWLLRLEREHFVALAQMPKTQARIAHMLKTGKPLRN